MATPTGSLSPNEFAYYQGAVLVAVTRIYQQEIAPLETYVKPVEELQLLVQTALQDSTFVAYLQDQNDEADRCYIVADRVAHMLTDETLEKIKAQLKALPQRESLKPWLEKDANLAIELEQGYPTLSRLVEHKHISPIREQIKERLLPLLPAQLSHLKKPGPTCTLL